MAGYAVIGAMLFLFLSDALYRGVVKRARPLLPDAVLGEGEAHLYVGALLWQPAFPRDLRRRYLLSIGCAALGAACVVWVAESTGHRYWAMFFAAILLVVLWRGLVGWTKYRTCP